ncbi:Bifunctional peptidase and (3S)-lysyl like protein [Argiope bruennichi]|uniref:Bifunctional peptidase and (3S)-lysyl like protein n=1 Tax=Argiope bruennichi TaxID=94029 RepID=A0A8T0F2K6_ARGBR|nr:Bifunctional peptidase and (3S)-lysyl like protein [Argiope bruennichi]
MDSLYSTLQDFVVDYCEYLPPDVPVLEEPPLPIEFLNNYVNSSVPFLITYDKFEEPPFLAVELWRSSKHIRMQNKKVTVAVTPDGRANAVSNDLFMVAEERRILFSKFFGELQLPQIKGFIFAKPPNNLIEDLDRLTYRGVDNDIKWASETFGSKPKEATIWMGKGQCVHSMHKDHYENIYYTLIGIKYFELYPPIAIGWMPYQKYKKYQWSYDMKKKSWKMNDLNEEVKGIPIDIRPKSREKYLMYSKTKSYHVQLRPGECLYIPAMWYHEVRQPFYSIAVNFVYDMKYDAKYPFLRLYKKLCQLPILRSDAAVDRQSELEESLLQELIEADLRRHRVFQPKISRK